MGYQLHGVNLTKSVETLKFPSTAPILPNLFNYFLCPISIIPGFPFIAGWANLNYTEQVTSILLASPFVWFGLVPLALLVPRWRKIVYEDKLKEEAREISWIVMCLVCAAVFAMVPVLMIFNPAMRYLADMTPSLVILSMIGVWQSHDLLRSTPLGDKSNGCLLLWDSRLYR